MKKNFFQMSKYFMLASALCMGMAFTACDDDDDEPKKPQEEQKEDKEDEKKEDEKKDDEKKDDDVKMEGSVIQEIDYTTYDGEVFWMSDANKEGDDPWYSRDSEGFHMNVAEAQEANYVNQYLILDHFDGMCVTGNDYKLYVTIDSEVDGLIEVHVGGWDHGVDTTFEFQKGSKTYEIEIAGDSLGEKSQHVKFNSAMTAGKYTIKFISLRMIE
ncbi:MAG: hypothetical protein MJZ01_04965 [Bacteroidales bacterium]|nr:hypothetical protein [Bacteroidales bacterium]